MVRLYCPPVAAAGFSRKTFRRADSNAGAGIEQ